MTAPPDQRSDFVRQKFEWLEQISRDGGLTFVAVRTAIALTQFFNRQTQHAWPAAATLADRLGVETRSVQRAKALLIERGHLVVIGDRRGGLNHTSRVKMRLKPGQANSMNNKEETTKLRQPCRSLDETTAAVTETTTGDDTKLRPGGRTNPLKEPLEESSSRTDLTKMTAEAWFASHTRPSAARLTAYELFKAAPPKALDIDIQIAKFTAFNADKRLSGEEWRNLWERWCHQAVLHARRASA